MGADLHIELLANVLVGDAVVVVFEAEAANTRLAAAGRRSAYQRKGLAGRESRDRVTSYAAPTAPAAEQPVGGGDSRGRVPASSVAGFQLAALEHFDPNARCLMNGFNGMEVAQEPQPYAGQSGFIASRHGIERFLDDGLPSLGGEDR